MHAWERETARADRRLGKDPSAADERRFTRARTAAKSALFRRYCTIRKRVHDDPSQLTWGSPPSYDPSRVTIVDARQPSPARIEITATDAGPPEMRFLYVILRKRGQWRIDHRKAWMQGGWSDYPLNL